MSLLESKDYNNHSKKSKAKFLIIDADMEDDMLISAYDFVYKNYESNMSNQKFAKSLKEEFETKYYPTWICIVGKSYGCKVVSQKKHYLCCQVDNRTIILFKYH